MKPHILFRETLIPKPLHEVFEFFSKAENLNTITPPELSFSIITPLPVEMKKGTIIDYKIKLNGIPFKWKTEITAWEPMARFVDKQIKGPYKMWVHEHRFYDKNGQTLMTDKVEFLSPGWFLEPVINNLFVSRKVNSIFDYREKRFKELFG